MKLDVRLPSGSLAAVPALARRLERAGFDGLFTAETHGDCFLPLALAAEHTSTCALGTAVAVAPPRNPVHVAHLADDLQRASGGRFALGLGTQTAAHLAERFGLEVDSPRARIAEFVAALRAIWAAWQTGESPRFEGDFWRHRLMPEQFRPPPPAVAPPPILLAAVGPRMTRLAAEVADGLVVHELHSADGLREATVPIVAEGLRAGGRRRDAFTTTVCVQVVTGTDAAATAAAREAVRRRIAFHAATPEYGPVLRAAGHEQLHSQLCGLARLGRMQEAGALVTDSVVEDFAVVAPPDELAMTLRERYGGVADRLLLNLPAQLDDDACAAVAGAGTAP